MDVTLPCARWGCAVGEFQHFDVISKVSLIALSAVLVAVPVQAQDAVPQPQPPPQAGVDELALPEVEVVTDTAVKPKKQKYPTPPVAKKPSVASPSAAVQSQGPVAGTSVAAPPPAQSTNAVPKIATTGPILGDRRGVIDAAGSAAIVDGEELYTSHVFTTNEALRKVPGVSVRDEEGFGLRPNIGIRGLNPTRSTKTLLLEDGLFVTFAPYGDNASYFHPSMDRYSSVEVLKGADQLLYGPQTISGTINYITPNPPKKPAGFVAGTVGNRDYANGQFNYGGWIENFGGLVDYVHKEGDGARDNTHHRVEDFGFKGVVQVSPDQAFIGKVSYFTEDSQVTYSGITDAEARNFGIRYNPFKNDTFETERVGLSLTHNWDLNPNISVASSVYYTSFDRDWWRQASTTTDTQCEGSVPTFRQDRIDGLRVDVDDCLSAQGRIRSYETRGFEQRWTFAYPLADEIDTQLKTGFRVHSEDQERRQLNATSPTGRTGDESENNEREAFAVSFFAQNKLSFGAFSVTPAMRYEDIDYERRNNLNGASGSSDVQAWIPGISVGFEPTRNFMLFAGVHEGFAPPRVEDSITNDGGSVDVDAESSINLEVGFKSNPIRGLTFDGTYFRNDFDNLIAVGSIAGGSVSLAQGEALFEGFELFTRLDSARFMNTGFNLYGQLAWTYLWTAEQSTAFLRVDNGDPVAGDTAGNRQPYAAEHLVTARVGYALDNFDAYVELVYIGEQFADFQNYDSPDDAAAAGEGSAGSGLFGKLDAQSIVNLGVTYTYEPTETDIFLAVKNVFDEDTIVDRTRGILPGAPQLIHVGVKQDF
ncbi:MAG: TonB-dependent receptor plug domain-containing protein [Hyphomicrobium sp.]|nr:TonB-dependent receptor plug domain-containing protein [Hyphomicrobium sp.]